MIELFWPKRLSGYLERKTPIVSEKNMNKIYITWSLNTAQVYKTHDQHISRTLTAHYTVTYVMSNFVFPLLCVSSAGVDFWVNGGWDQPNCEITLNVTFLGGVLQNMDPAGKICNFLIIYAPIIVFQILKTVLIKTQFHITSFCFEVSKKLKPCIFKQPHSQIWLITKQYLPCLYVYQFWNHKSNLMYWQFINRRGQYSESAEKHKE